MFIELLIGLFLFYLLFIFNRQAAVVAPEPPITTESESLDNWKLDSEGGITLPCSTPSPPLGLSRSSTPETVIPLAPPREQLKQISQAYQDLIDSQEQNWWTPSPSSYEGQLPGLIRHPAPSIAKGPRNRRRYQSVH